MSVFPPCYYRSPESMNKLDLFVNAELYFNLFDSILGFELTAGTYLRCHEDHCPFCHCCILIIKFEYCHELSQFHEKRKEQISLCNYKFLFVTLFEKEKL